MKDSLLFIAHTTILVAIFITGIFIGKNYAESQQDIIIISCIDNEICKLQTKKQSLHSGEINEY